MNNLFLHRSLTESKNTFLNGVLTSDIIYGDSGSFNFRNDIWTYPHETVFHMMYGERYTIYEHLAPFGLVYLKELTGYFAEGPNIGTSGFYNNLSIDEDLRNVNSSIETGCNTHRQTDWVKGKPGQEAYFDKNVTSKDDPDLKGRIYVGKTFRELRENNFLYYGDEKGDLYQDPRPIFGLKEDTREADGQGLTTALGNFFSNHFYVGAEGEISYGVQLTCMISKTIGININPVSKIIVEGNINNRGQSIDNYSIQNASSSDKVKAVDFGVAWIIGGNYNWNVVNGKMVSQTVSLGVFGFGSNLTWNKTGVTNLFVGYDLGEKIAVGYGAIDSVKIRFIWNL